MDEFILQVDAADKVVTGPSSHDLNRNSASGVYGRIARPDFQLLFAHVTRLGAGVGGKILELSIKLDQVMNIQDHTTVGKFHTQMGEFKRVATESKDAANCATEADRALSGSPLITGGV